MAVFVSYSSHDRAVADTIVQGFERAQLTCWYAPRDIRPGSDYAEAIVEGLRSSRVLVVIVSAHSLASAQVLREVERAIHYGIEVMPVRIDNTPISGSFEFFLSLPHWLEASSPPQPSDLDRLEQAIRRFLGAPARPVGQAGTSPAEPPAPVVEITPDAWSRKPGGRLRRFFDTMLQDPQS
jgi:hypothetical protein